MNNPQKAGVIRFSGRSHAAPEFPLFGDKEKPANHTNGREFLSRILSAETAGEHSCQHGSGVLEAQLAWHWARLQTGAPAQLKERTELRVPPFLTIDLGILVSIVF